MIVRKAGAEDIPGIVALLKASLGESLMPKSESFWKWKHVENPFGASPVLIAVENDVIIGVRAFMRWQWREGDKVLKAVRAVDTATHPDHQGKGIFRKLTLALIEECQQEGVHFIFNTPNTQSMPGYLKMGWKTLGKLRVQMTPVFPIGKATHHSCAVKELDNLLVGRVLNRISPTTSLTTNYSASYIQWRYGTNPNAEYRALFADDSYLVIFRLKQSKAGKELRVTDLFCDSRARREVALKLRRVARASGAVVITMTSDINPFRLHPTAKIGPQVTVRNLTLEDFENSINFTRWRPALGDLELF